MVVLVRWPVMLCGAALASLVFLSACTSALSPVMEQAHLQRLRGELITRGDPDSLITAAFLERFAVGEWHDPGELAARAAAAAPQRADLAFVQLLLCYQTSSCAPAPLEARLRALDPANGISWLFDLGRATRADDIAGINIATFGLAGSQRVNLYWPALVSHMTAAVTGHAGFDQDSALVLVVGIDAAMVLPPLQPVSRSCDGTATVNADVLARCRSIAAAFERADSILFESYGHDLAARLWPQDSLEGIAIAARRRVLDYRSDLWTTKQRQLDSPHAERLLATLLRQYPTEQQAYVALYTELGLNPEPPADWKKPAPHG